LIKNTVYINVACKLKNLRTNSTFIFSQTLNANAQKNKRAFSFQRFTLTMLTIVCCLN